MQCGSFGVNIQVFIIRFKAKSKWLDHLHICIRNISLALWQQRGHASLQSAINELTAGGRRWHKPEIVKIPAGSYLTSYMAQAHSDINEQNSFHFIIDAPLVVPGVSKIWKTKLKSTLVSCSPKILPKLKKLWKPSKLNKNCQWNPVFWRFFEFYCTCIYSLNLSLLWYT